MLFGGTPGLRGACRGRRALLTARSSGKRRSVTHVGTEHGVTRRNQRPFRSPERNRPPSRHKAALTQGRTPPKRPISSSETLGVPAARGRALGRSRAATQLCFLQTPPRPGQHLHFHRGVPRRAGRLLGLLAPSSAVFAAFSPSKHRHGTGTSEETTHESTREGAQQAPRALHQFFASIIPDSPRISGSSQPPRVLHVLTKPPRAGAPAR